MRVEAVDGIPPTRSVTLQELQAILEAAGIEFIGGPNDRPGIRISNEGPRRQLGLMS